MSDEQECEFYLNDSHPREACEAIELAQMAPEADAPCLEEAEGGDAEHEVEWQRENQVGNKPTLEIMLAN